MPAYESGVSGRVLRRLCRGVNPLLVPRQELPVSPERIHWAFTEETAKYVRPRCVKLKRVSEITRSDHPRDEIAAT